MTGGQRSALGGGEVVEFRRGGRGRVGDLLDVQAHVAPGVRVIPVGVVDQLLAVQPELQVDRLDGRASSFCPLYPVTLRRYAPLPV
jgi:hypothetical protein